MKNQTTSFFALLAIATFTLFAISCNNDKAAEAEAANQPPIPVTAIKLLADYEANKKTADEQYKGKMLLVSGEVLGVTTNHDGTSFVLINSPESSIGSVRCMFAAEQSSTTAALVREQQTTIKGICAGLDEVQVVIKNSAIHDAATVAANGRPQDHPNNKKALEQILAEEKINTAFISDGNILYASVINDGSAMEGYAKHLCSVLQKNKATTKWVKVIESETGDPSNPDNPFGLLLAEWKCD